MRQRAEHELDLLQRCIFGGRELQIAAVDACRRPALFVRGRERELELRMAPDEAAKLSARVPAGAENSNWNLIHR